MTLCASDGLTRSLAGSALDPDDQKKVLNESDISNLAGFG
jgi:hypothetical protein